MQGSKESPFYTGPPRSFEDRVTEALEQEFASLREEQSAKFDKREWCFNPDSNSFKTINGFFKTLVFQENLQLHKVQEHLPNLHFQDHLHLQVVQ